MEWPCTSCTPPLRQPWLADPRLGAVVVATHSQKWQVGQLVDVMLPVGEIGATGSNCMAGIQFSRARLADINNDIIQNHQRLAPIVSKPPRR